MKKTYPLSDLDCANCAQKMEDAIRRLDGVQGYIRKLFHTKAHHHRGRRPLSRNHEAGGENLPQDRAGL